MNITIQIPNSWLSRMGLPGHLVDVQPEIVAFTKKRLEDALAAYAGDAQSIGEPEGGGEKPSTRLMFSLPSAQASVLAAVSKACGLTPGPMAKRLLGRLAADASPVESHEARVPANHPLAETNRRLGFGVRAEQIYFYDNLVDAMASKSVGLVEGGTGIGKTRAMVRAALHWVETEGSNCAIAVPTVALLRQFLAEYKMQSEGVDEAPEVQAIMGRSEFVSEVALRDFLHGPGRDWATPQVQQWIGRNGRNENEDESESWQMNSLLQCSPQMPTHEVELGALTFNEDKGYQAYRKQFVKMDGDGEALAPRLLIFTHAMLAQDLRRRMFAAGGDPVYRELQSAYSEACRAVRGKDASTDDYEAMEVAGFELGIAFAEVTEMKGLLPDYPGLIVDEAHQLDQIISNSVSDYISLRSLQSQFFEFKSLGGRIGTGTLDSIAGAVSRLSKNAPKVDKRDFAVLSSDSEMLLIPSLQHLAEACCSISKVREKNSRKFLLSLQIRTAGKLIKAAIDPQKGMPFAFLRHSPIRSLPQLIVSSSQSRTIVNRLWNSVRGCALVSATLYLKTSDGPSASFSRSVIGVPDARAKTYAPIHAAWSVSTVASLYVEQADSRLCPPSSAQLKDEDMRDRAMSSWHDSVAQAIMKNAESAAGGTLVLCTSLETAGEVYKRLVGSGIPKEKLVYANGADSIVTQRNKFLQARKNGLKAIWLAVGGAWAGLDVGGHTPWRELFGEEIPASEDNVLTDLVIPRLPFRTNQSISHLWRMRTNPGFPWDYLDAALRFTQGIGRLVRREGLPKNRRIFILDARLSEPKRASQLVPFVQAIKPYLSN